MTDAERRNHVVQEMIRTGIRVEDARMAVDLAIHACDEAIKTMQRVCDAAPQPVSSLANITAMKYLSVNIESALQVAALSALMGTPPKQAMEIYDAQLRDEAFGQRHD